MINFLKGSLQASFLIFICLYATTSTAQFSPKVVANDPQWQALLHIHEDEPVIKSSFLLSGKHFSPLNELTQTIALLDSSKQHTKACQFIARHYYLSVIKNYSLPPITCPGYETFTRQVPADHISVLFASENLSQPASIMGHTMMALSDSQFSTQHSVSFFTELTTANPIKLIWENLIVGQPGYFLVQPLQKNLDQYIDKEQRNIWRYPITLSDQDKQLFLRHLWELKSAPLEYLFSAHNCATLTLDILRVVNPSLKKHRQNWVSPIDVVKAAEQEGMLGKPLIYGSAKWKIRLLSDTTNQLADHEQVDSSKPNTILAGLLSYEKNRYDYLQGDTPKTDWYKKSASLSLRGLDINQHSISLDKSRSPLLTPKDSQWGFSSVQYQAFGQTQSAMNIYWMPASHQLMDDNQQYASENALKILMLKAAVRENNLQLDSVHLYQAESYLNNNRYIGGTSGRFGIGLKRFPIQQSEQKLASYIDGALGKTLKAHKDLSLYGFWRAGLRANTERIYATTGPEVGLFFYWVGGMKTHLKYSKLWRSRLTELESFDFKHTLLKWNDGSLKLSYTQERWNNLSRYSGEVGFSFYY